MIKIEKYSFGRLTVAKKNYTTDVILLPDDIVLTWQRQKSHFVILPDINDLLETEFDHLCVGTGFYGLMKIDEEIILYCKKRNIQLFIGKTKQAIDKFNSLTSNKKAAALHLTC
jgi:hypothetical protein